MVSAQRTLRVFVERAEMKRDTDLIGKMDPWCQLDIGTDQKVRTRTIDGAGKNPEWQ